MLATEFLHGQGLGNQLFAYVTTRVLAHVDWVTTLVLKDFKTLEIPELIRKVFIL